MDVSFVIFYSFGIDSNIAYSTKGINSGIIEYMMFQNSHIFSYFIKYIWNGLKIDQWPVLKHPDIL